MMPLRSFVAALGFLTILPLPRRWREDHEALGRSVIMFPLVGLIVGLIVTLCDLLFQRALPSMFASIATAVAMIVVSGGLHMDGLSDTADGFFSSRSRERSLEIMRDSRIGAMGVIAIVSVFALKSAALLELSTPYRSEAIFLVVIAGRCAMVIPMSLLPYARTEGGLASVFHPHRSIVHAVWACAFLLASGFLLLGSTGASVALVVIAASYGMGMYIRGKIGGMTGDTLGAVCELGELLLAMSLLAAYRLVFS